MLCYTLKINIINKKQATSTPGSTSIVSISEGTWSRVPARGYGAESSAGCPPWKLTFARQLSSPGASSSNTSLFRGILLAAQMYVISC